MSRLNRLAIVAGAIGTLVACDYSGDWLFAGDVENMPGVYHIFAEDGTEYITPIEAATLDDVRAQMIMGEIAPTGTAATGGATLNFLGTGGAVCVYVDPETVFWNWTVQPAPPQEAKTWKFPDNVYDDGDIDLYVGLSAYYTGSPGVAVGDFIVSYTDSLGNEVPIELSACTNFGIRGQGNAHSGRGAPEFCNIPFTDPGVSYTALLQTFSTPLDDDRLGYGLIVYDGSCTSLQNLAGVGQDPSPQECLILGESILPLDVQAGQPNYCYGAGCLPSWAGVAEFESEYCLGTSSDMKKFCSREFDAHVESGFECQRETVIDQEARCFCGDENDIPTPGAI